jgi:hypothetical protein
MLPSTVFDGIDSALADALEVEACGYSEEVNPLSHGHFMVLKFSSSHNQRD